jgi:hypothetical protein
MNLTPLSSENHFRTDDHFVEREGPGVSFKQNQKGTAGNISHGEHGEHGEL